MTCESCGKSQYHCSCLECTECGTLSSKVVCGDCYDRLALEHHRCVHIMRDVLEMLLDRSTVTTHERCVTAVKMLREFQADAR